MKPQHVLICIALVALSFFAGSFFHLFPSNDQYTRSLEKKYPYISRKILRDDPNDTILNFYRLRMAIEGYAQKEKLDMGIHFQYLPTGVTIGLNKDKPYIAASLLKLPTVIATQKMIEQGIVDAEDEITITDELIDQRYGDLYKDALGRSLSINELMKISVQKSDNTASNVLFHRVIGGQPANFYNALDVPANIVDGVVGLTPKNYSSILHSLYFSSYLSLDGSNKILDLLTNISDGEVLRADIPENVKIAQKIGVYESTPGEGPHTYSFCGIFYVPKRPYSLCIMTNDEKSEVDKHVKEISSQIYHFVQDASFEQRKNK